MFLSISLPTLLPLPSISSYCIIFGQSYFFSRKILLLYSLISSLFCRSLNYHYSTSFTIQNQSATSEYWCPLFIWCPGPSAVPPIARAGPADRYDRTTTCFHKHLFWPKRNIVQLPINYNDYGVNVLDYEACVPVRCTVLILRIFVCAAQFWLLGDLL